MATADHHDQLATDGATAHLAHHFDTPQQQFESAVLGMWLFLATEILLFGGMFCAYAVYRAAHPEVFIYAHHYLEVKWGATNTVILLCSSFTMAAAVWAAQHSRQRMLVWMLAITILCGLGFMGIKFVEYKHKWEAGLGWGKHYQPTHAPGEHGHEAEVAAAEGTAAAFAESHANEATPTLPPAATKTDEAAGDTPADKSATSAPAAVDENWMFEPADTGPRGLLAPGHTAEVLAPRGEVRNVQLFFAVYFGMTGLHGLHVLGGLSVIAWILVRSLKGHFNADYFTPVPMVGLYWHVVDLIWIYLFPLLYLIH